jgi:hypothetical protein
MSDEGDDAEGHDELPPTVSRIDRSNARRYRVRSRGRRFMRVGKQLPAGEVIRRLLEHRRRCVCIYWAEIVGEDLASKTFPVSFSESVLHVSATSSSWVQELHWRKAQLIAMINNWVEANRRWLGPPPLVLDIRGELGVRQRKPLVEQDHVRRLLSHYTRRKRPPREVLPLVASEAEREAIRAETNAIADPELRALVESVRLKWNR